MLKIMLT